MLYAYAMILTYMLNIIYIRVYTRTQYRAIPIRSIHSISIIGGGLGAGTWRAGDGPQTGHLSPPPKAKKL